MKVRYKQAMAKAREESVVPQTNNPSKISNATQSAFHNRFEVRLRYLRRYDLITFLDKRHKNKNIINPK